MTVVKLSVRRALVVLVAVAALNLFAEGEQKMPTLNWMGREKATKSVKDVVMKIVREDKSLGESCQCANVTSTNSNNQLGNGSVGNGNNSTLATLNTDLAASASAYAERLPPPPRLWWTSRRTGCVHETECGRNPPNQERGVWGVTILDLWYNLTQLETTRRVTSEEHELN